MTISNAPDAPIIVNGSTLPATATSAIRWIVGMILAYAVGKGWIAQENVEGIAAAIIAVGAGAYGVWKTNQRQGNLIVAAKSADNKVAVVK